MVGHARDVIADDAGKRLGFGLLAIVVRKAGGIFHPEGEQLADDALGVVLFPGEGGAEVKILVEKSFGLFSFGFHFGAERGQALGMAAHVVQGLNSRLLYSRLRIDDQVSHQAVEHALQGFVELQLLWSFGIKPLDLGIEALEDGQTGADLVEREQMGFVAVVEVGGVVGDFVGEVDELGFEGRALVEQIFGQFRVLFCVVVARLLDDALADFEGEIEAAEGRVALFKIFHDAQGVQVVVEKKAVGAHGAVEGLFAGVAEGGMAEVMDQSEGFHQIDVEAELRGDGAGNLRNLEGVGEAVAEVVGIAPAEDLGLGFEAAEGAGVDDSVAVALKIVAVGVGRLGKAASAGVLRVHRVAGQHGESLAEGRVWLPRPSTTEGRRNTEGTELLVTLVTFSACVGRLMCYQRCGAPAPNRATSKPNRQPESRVKRTGLSVLSIIFLCLAALAAQNPGSANVSSGTAPPVNTIQLTAWLIGGIPGQRLVRIIRERGVAWMPSAEELRHLEAAGADAKLVHALTGLKPSVEPQTSAGLTKTEIPASLIHAANEARQRRYHEAERDLRQALTNDPNDAALHFALGAMLRQQEHWDDAFDEMTQSARLMPDFPENHGSLAYIFYRLDDGPNAIAEARTALSMDPQNAEAYQFLGLGFYSSGEYAAAAHAFAESLARDPENADTYYDLGITLYADGDLPAAAKVYREALRLNPAFWQAHSNLALTLHQEGKLNEAIAEYREAKRLAPDEASVRNNLGNTYCDHGDFDAALSEMTELYRKHPEWEQGHGCLAQAYLSKKNYGSAVEELEQAVRLNPSSAAEHRALGQALLLDGKGEEAVLELRLAVTLNPDSDAAHHFLGTALFQQQQLQAAEKEFREALRLKPSADNHYALAACLMSLDRYEEAMVELDTAAQLDPQHTLYRARREELRKLMKENSTR